MRLRQIKLAGFKSFIDPTNIDVPGALVGVVGPNGCGKSNVIDAVRWVLGESKAAELRGESMQDVIFNGSANRKPAGRASVELMFDNLDGRIGGEWSTFAEISVKRVLTRDGASSYLINNQQVRRRDVQDMFLGTGLGPRAYAIIGQGMITRIIEARPDELRVFLEEAAGVSKYKERRRETENRLADTRDNLTRVEDILRELDAQIARLEQQAEVAQRYRDLQARHDEQQQLLWLTRKRDAQAEQEKVARDIDSRTTALEAHLAELRGVERLLEEARTARDAASDATHAAQGEVLQVNAEIGKLENEIRLILDSRTRLAAQIESLVGSRERHASDAADMAQRVAELSRTIDEGADRQRAAQTSCEQHDARLPQFEESYRAARDALAAAQAEAALAEQAIEAAGEQQRAFDRQLGALTARRERLHEERTHLGSPEEDRLQALRADIDRMQSEVDGAAARRQAREQQILRLEADRQDQIDTRARETEALAKLEARLHALRELQSNVEADERLDPWLRGQGLDGLPRLFRRIHVESGWESAFEAVLRERVEALEVGRLDTLAALAGESTNAGTGAGTGAVTGSSTGAAGNAPPSRVAFYSTSNAFATPAAALGGFAPLAERMRGHDAALAAVVADWLAGVYAADDLAVALAARDRLPPGGQFVVRSGHIVSRHGVRFFAADDRKAGLLARRQEIENLDRELRAQRLQVEQTAAALARCEAGLRQSQAANLAENEAAEKQRAQLHAQQLDAVRLVELIDRVRHRTGQIEAELGEVQTLDDELRSQRGEAEARFEQLDQELAERQAEVEAKRNAYEEADRQARDARTEQQRLASERQRVDFEVDAARKRREDVEHAIEVARREAERIAADIERADLDLARLDDSAARGGLDTWLARRSQAEEALRQARSRLEDLTQQLRATDEKRQTLERDVQPRRDKLTELQLKEQAARLAFEQFAQQLAEARADEAALEPKLAGAGKANALQAEILRLAQEIEALGAVNLAALDELTSSRERKTFLDSQSADLNAAIATLEDAIRKIDRETRELLQQTFDQVNFQFGQLFPRLFGGGEARLLMTGEQILDAGVQVMAQPPGKRNSTIHLLSGGEKALTATALVFALFKLNPAPFCLLDEVDAPLDDANTDRFCNLVRSMTAGSGPGGTQFLFITHNKIAMEMAEQLIGVTMQEQGVSRIVAVDIDSAVRLTAEAA